MGPNWPDGRPGADLGCCIEHVRRYPSSIDSHNKMPFPSLGRVRKRRRCPIRTSHAFPAKELLCVQANPGKKNRNLPGFWFRRLSHLKDVKNLSSVLTRLLPTHLPSTSRPRLPLAHERQHFRDYHLLLDEHASQIFGITDP